MTPTTDDLHREDERHGKQNMSGINSYSDDLLGDLTGDDELESFNADSEGDEDTEETAGKVDREGRVIRRMRAESQLFDDSDADLDW